MATKSLGQKESSKQYLMSDHQPKKSSKSDIAETAGMFQAIAEMGEVGILILDNNNRIEFANRMVSEITGYSVDDLLGKKFTDFLDKKNRKFFQTLKKEWDTCKTKLCQVIQITTASSTPAVIEMCFTSYPVKSPGPVKYFVYLRDISVQKKLTEELRESEKKHRDLFERVDQGICITTKEGKILDCNPALLKMLGYESKEEFLKLNVATDLYANPEDREEFQNLTERDGHVKNYEVEFKKKNGDKLPILMTAHVRKNEKGEVTGYQGIIIDISERIRIEQELREKHGFLTNLLESSVDCIVVADMKGNVIFFNKSAEKLTGYSEEEVIGKFHITRFYPREVAKDVMKKLRSDNFGGRGKLENLMLTIYGKNNEELPVSLAASIVYEGEKEIASLGIFTDLREKIKIERELQETQVRLLQSEKMASLGSLAAGVAHEINNPLGGILIFASLLMEDFEANDDPRVQDLKKIVEEGTRCKEIVRSLLEFGRQTESKFEPMDINKAIIDGLFFLENQVLFHDIRIIKQLDPALPLIQGNANQLKQVFMNIMVNAAEAMSDEGGSLTITTAKSQDESSIIISFKDTGTGIPPEVQSRIFDPFFTTKEVGKGTGLGLSTSYGIIQSHHGNIEVESEVGKKTTFNILLPVSKEEVP
jgi:two-component system NtrC family sensor kinase